MGTKISSNRPVPRPSASGGVTHTAAAASEKPAAKADSFTAVSAPDAKKSADALKTWALQRAKAGGKEAAASAIPALLNAAENLTKAGRPEAAKELYEVLQKEPYASAKTNLAVGMGEGTGKDRVNEDLVRDADTLTETGAQIAARGLSQIEWSQKLGGKPYDINAVRDYFRKLPKNKVEGEFQSYLDAFYKHPGNGVSDLAARSDAQKNELENPNNLNSFLSALPKDQSGRVLVNCVGYSLIAGAVFKGDPRFAVGYVGDASHMEARVFNKLPNGNVTTGFEVDSGRLNKLEGGPLPLEVKLRAGSQHGVNPADGWAQGMRG